jgi:hypothetical protein
MTRTERSLNTIQAGVGEITTSVSFMASNTNIVAKIVREEIRTTLKLLLEQGFTALGSHVDDKVRSMEEMASQISSEISRENAAMHSHANSNVNDAAVINKFYDQTLAYATISDQPQYLVKTRRHMWVTRSKIGSLQVKFSRTVRLLGGSPCA